MTKRHKLIREDEYFYTFRDLTPNSSALKFISVKIKDGNFDKAQDFSDRYTNGLINALIFGDSFHILDRNPMLQEKINRYKGDNIREISMEQWDEFCNAGKFGLQKR